MSEMDYIFTNGRKYPIQRVVYHFYKPSMCIWNWSKPNNHSGIDTICAHKDRMVDILECSDYKMVPDGCPLNQNKEASDD